MTLWNEFSMAVACLYLPLLRYTFPFNHSLFKYLFLFILFEREREKEERERNREGKQKETSSIYSPNAYKSLSEARPKPGAWSLHAQLPCGQQELSYLYRHLSPSKACGSRAKE